MATGQDIKLDSDLYQPDKVSELEKADTDIKHFTGLLKGGDLEAFYNELDHLFSSIDNRNKEDSVIDELAKQMWIYYYISAGPVFQININDNTKSPYTNDSLDYEVKQKAVSNMLRLTLYLDQIEIRYGWRRKDMGVLLGQYSGHILKQFRENYDETWRLKAKKMKEQRVKEMFNEAFDSERVEKAGPDGTSGGMQEKDRNFFNKLTIFENRNIRAKFCLESKEGDFVTILVRCCPGQGT